MTGANVLEVRDLVKSFRIHQERANSLKQRIAARGRNRFEEFLAVDGVTFDVKEGEVLGVIGQNGAGKSTLLKCMAGILRPNSGSVTVHRRMSALLELGAGFHPDLTGRENVFLNAAILGMGRKEIAARFDDIVEFSGLQQFIDQPVKTYSSGMFVRLGFAVAINVDPTLLLVDEVLAVGDLSFQQRCLEKFIEFRNDGRTIVLVTHSMVSVRDMCDRAVWIRHGKLVGDGDPADMVNAYTSDMMGGNERVEGKVTRHGSGELQITDVSLTVGDDPQPVKRCRTGDSITLTLHYEASKAVPMPVVGLQITTVQGVIITSPCSRDVGAVPERLEGSGTITFTIPRVDLLPGTYVVNTDVTDFNRAHIYDHLQPALQFDVTTGKPYEQGGLVTFHPSWDVGQSRG